MNNESMLFSKKRILTVKQLSKLTHHTYACNNTSVLEPFLQPWWNFLVSKTPIWLAPNLITILGLIVNIATTLVLVVYSPNGVSSPPRWTCVLCAVGLFIYQSLDSIDGKQARRTNTSSPLGELFDHGCDAISTVFVALAACLSCQLGHYPKWLFFQCFCAIVLFYCAHWQTYVSGTLRFGNIDVTEAQFIIILIHLTSAIFGSEIWMAKIFGNVELWFFISLLTTACCIWSLSHTCSIILNGGAGKNGSTVAGTSVLSPSIPLSLVLFLAYIIARKSPENVFVENASLYIISFGMITAKITNKLVIAHMTKAEIEYLDSSLLGPAIMLLNQYFNCVLPEIWLLWFTLFWAMQDLIRYCLQVCLEIRTHLHIGIFTISRQQRGTINPVTKTMVSCGTTAGDKKNAKYRQRLTR